MLRVTVLPGTVGVSVTGEKMATGNCGADRGEPDIGQSLKSPLKIRDFRTAKARLTGPVLESKNQLV